MLNRSPDTDRPVQHIARFENQSVQQNVIIEICLIRFDGNVVLNGHIIEALQITRIPQAEVCDVPATREMGMR